MTGRALVAVFALAWSMSVSAEEAAVPPGPGNVIWLPVLLPAGNYPVPYFMPPPFVWWLQAMPQALAPMPPASALVPPVIEPAPVATPAPAVLAEPAAPDPDGAGAAQAVAEPVAKPVAKTGKPKSGKHKTSGRKRGKDAKTKLRKLCWKDDRLAPCP